jgi:hypothetical protein
VKVVEAFLKDIDAAWPPAASKIRLCIIGSTALMMQTSYHRLTKDSDILETESLTEETCAKLRQLGGQRTPLHKRWSIYIDIVPGGLVLRRQAPQYSRLLALSEQLRSFDIEVMSVLDVVVSKLARFKADDRADIDAMVERGLVDHDELVRCFEDAIDFKQDIDCDQFAMRLRNLRTVERDMLGVEPTHIEEPSWVR